MNYILLVGEMHSGKSTTVNEVVEKLVPIRIRRFKQLDDGTFELAEDALGISITNGTYLIEVNGKSILIVAGAPTEQKITITLIIIEIQKLARIDFAIISIRSIERKAGYNTRSELVKFGDCVLEIPIIKVEGGNYKETSEWRNRIVQIMAHIVF